MVYWLLTQHKEPLKAREIQNIKFPPAIPQESNILWNLLQVISHFSDVWALVGEKSQKKLGEIQKKKFHPVISGAFF